jgi:hypothetical protein
MAPATEEPPVLPPPPAKLPPGPEQPNPATKMNRIVLQTSPSQVHGLIVNDKSAPRGDAKLVFVSVRNQAETRRTSADAAGSFRLVLSPGSWFVYLEQSDGTRSYHSRVEVEEQAQPVRITLVSR